MRSRNAMRGVTSSARQYHASLQRIRVVAKQTLVSASSWKRICTSKAPRHATGYTPQNVHLTQVLFTNHGYIKQQLCVHEHNFVHCLCTDVQTTFELELFLSFPELQTINTTLQILTGVILCRFSRSQNRLYNFTEIESFPNHSITHCCAVLLCSHERKPFWSHSHKVS